MKRTGKSKADTQHEQWLRTAEDASLGEDRALALLKHADLPDHVIEALSKNNGLRDSRRVKLRIATHPHTPRRLARSLLRQMYPFDLMQATLTAGIAGDVQRAAEDLLIRKLESLTLGERISLARRSPGRVAASLLVGQPRRVQEIALQNSRLTETLLLAALRKPASAKDLPELAAIISTNFRWKQNKEVNTALTELLCEGVTHLPEVE